MDDPTKDVSRVNINKENQVIDKKNPTNLNQVNNNRVNSKSKINLCPKLDEIFKFDTINKSLSTYPKIDKDKFKEIIDVFNKGIIPNFETKKELFHFIKDEINSIIHLKSIVNNRYEILDMINKFCKNNNFSLLEFFIDLYFKFVDEIYTQNPVSDIIDKDIFGHEYINSITDSINWIMSCGFIEKKNFDKVFRKLAALQLSSKLTEYKFYEYLNLLEILYGKKSNIKKYKGRLIAPKYIYFYDKKNSGIYTNIEEGKNEIKVKDKEGISIFTWFFNTEENLSSDEIEPVLVEIIINDFLFEVILTRNNDIVIKSEGKLLSNLEKIPYNIPKLKWVQLKIQLVENQFKLNVFQGDIKGLSESGSSFNYYHQKHIKYDTKTFKIDNIPKSSLNNLTIKKINFYKNFLGIVGTIIFCNKKNESEYPVKSEFGINDNNIMKFLSEPPISDNYFIFAPRFFINDKNKFFDSFYNISGSFINDKNNNAEFNSVFKYKNFTNIYNLGGIENILPLFEIFYKFSIQNKKGKEEELLYLIFKKIIRILENILVNNKKNYYEVLYVTNAWQNNTFLQSLQLFMELIDEKFYRKDNDIINCLINIGKSIYFNLFYPYSNRFDKFSYFYTYILFNPNIIIKFNISQIELLWKFLEQSKKLNAKVKVFDVRRCFMTWDQINKFLILLSDKYRKSKEDFIIMSNHLMSIIKIVFEDINTKDNDRENLILLCNYNELNENIIYGIIEIINNYLDKNDKNKKEQNINPNTNIKNQKEVKNKNNSNSKNQTNMNLNYPEIIKQKEQEQRMNLINIILNTKNNNIEILLKLFSSKNRNIKKAIIKLFKTLILDYGDIFDNYFNEIDNLSKKEDLKKVDKKNFFLYLEENIMLNYFFKRIIPDNSKDKLNLIGEYHNFPYPFNEDDEIKKLNINENEEKEKKDKININIINDEDNKENKIKDIKPLNKNKLLKKKRANSNIDKIKKNKKKLEIINNDIKEIRNIVRNFTAKNRNIHKVGINILKKIYESKKNKKTEQNEIKSNIEEQKETIQIYHINIDADKISIIENDSSQIINNIKVNVEMSKILFDLLMNYNPPNKNSIIIDNSTNPKSNVSKKGNLDKSIKNKTINNSNTFEEEKIINLLVKFLQNTRELEVIHEVLFSILNQKWNTDNYNQLLDYFCYTKTDFLQLIEELLITSFLCINDEEYKYRHIFVSLKNKISSISKEEYFKIIFMHSNDLLVNLYFHKNNQNSNKIIDGIINLILFIAKKSGKKTDYEKNKLFNLLLKLLDDFLGEINNTFISKKEEGEKSINSEEKSFSFKLKNPFKDTSSDNTYNSTLSKLKPYFEFFPYLFEYCLLKNYDIFSLEKHKNYVMKIDAGFPEFSSIISINNFTLYYNFMKYTFDFLNVFKNLEALKFSLKKIHNTFDEKKEIFILEKDFLAKLVKDFILNKEYKNELKLKIELFLIKNNKSLESDYLTILEIITIFNNYYIEKYIDDEDSFTSNSKCEFNYIYLLNYHQFFIINTILVSCILKENDSFLSTNKTYKDIQDLLFVCLKYNINNIILHCESKYSNYFITMFINIFLLISKIYEIYNDKSGKIYFNKTCLKKFVDYYSNKYPLFFNKENLISCTKNTFENNKKLLEEHIKKINETILFRSSDEIKEKPIIDIFETRKFLKLYYQRSVEYKQMKLLLNKDSDMLEINDFVYYQDLFNKIQKFVAPYENKLAFNESFLTIRKRNNYRKIKKKLYSWNYSYSNFDIFFNKENQDRLKYKISNFLCKDLTRKVIVPILDFDFYVPQFKKFEWQNNLFRNNKDNPEKNIYETLYNIDLKIFDNIPNIILPQLDNPNFFVEEVCYIKTNHHVNGLLFFHKNQSPIFFASKIPKSKEELMNNSNFDSDNCRCFGSIFGREFTQKEKEMYFKLSFSEIDFIFIRKYCFRNNAFEIFTNRHKSYYFKFEDNSKRDNFLENIISLANKLSISNRQAFKPIKGIDEFNKQTIIGYYKDEEDLKQYSSISNIAELWKNSKISTLEYLMWINIYGNRSYQDIGQYPVFPWLLVNYESNNFEELISKSQNIRDFRLPMGMMAITEKGKFRQDGYLESYKLMIIDLDNQELVKIKVKDEDSDEDLQDSERKDSSLGLNNKADKNKNYKEKSKKTPNPTSSQYKKAIVSVVPKKISPNCEKIPDDKLLKLSDYNISIDKLYFNMDIPYEMLPYIYGSHYSNAMYVSHYLCRLFPFAFAAIEIQGVGFDCPDRLFINLQNSVISAVSEKGDVREIIPDFFCIPEMFININNLNLGSIKNKPVENVIMPSWCDGGPYTFIENYRSLLEWNNLNINPWIDLIFGVTQKGKLSQVLGNIFLPFAYDGVINYRIKPEELVNNRAENEFKMRLFEMGVNPTKVFEKKNKIVKNKINDEIITKQFDNDDSNEIFYAIKLKNEFKNVIYFSTKNTLFDEIYIIDKNFIEEKLQILDYKEPNIYLTKEISSNRQFPFTDIIKNNIEYKLIVKQIFHNEIYIITGLFDGELHLFKNTNKIENNIDKFEYSYDKEIMKKFDKSLITALVIDKDDKYIIYGTQKGSIVIYLLNYYIYKGGSDESFLSLYKFFPSHPGFSIKYICLNSDLNLFADCAYDGFVNIYSFPKSVLLRSIYIMPKINDYFNLDYVFLSAQPLPSIVLYSNDTNTFKIFSLNGRELKYKVSNEKANQNLNPDDNEKIKTRMISPIIFTDSQFNDYLLYILNNKTVFVHKFPSMEVIIFISPLPKDDIYLTNVCISNDLKSIYVYDEKNNMIYVVHNNTIDNNNLKK